MIVATVRALKYHGGVARAELNHENIIPSALDKNVAAVIAKAVAEAAKASGVARI